MTVFVVVIMPKQKVMERYEGRQCVDAVEVVGEITPEKVETFRITPTDLTPVNGPEAA